MKALYLVAITALACRLSLAVDGCQNPKTPYDRTYCTAKLFLESDNELNAVYKELKGALKKEMKEKLTEVQREWIAFRDQSCSSNGTIEVQCNFDLNKARAEFLRDRARECKTGHCREDLIPQKSWEKK
jgi:uncharacterized protein YecT (DUF1311 family)